MNDILQNIFEQNDLLSLRCPQQSAKTVEHYKICKNSIGYVARKIDIRNGNMRKCKNPQ